MKKKIIGCFLIIFTCICLNLGVSNYIVFANEISEIQDEINSELNEINFVELENILHDISDNSKTIFGESSFFDKVQQFINGNYYNDLPQILKSIFELFFNNILNILPIILLILGIVILFSLVTNFGSNIQLHSNFIINFVCYGIIIIIISSLVSNCVTSVTDCMAGIKTQMEIIFPILLTLITAVGGSVTASAFQTPIIILINGTTELFSFILLPLFLISFVFVLANNLGNNEHFSKFISIFQSVFKWILGLILTLFVAFMVLSGITSGTFDGISVKIAKYTLKGIVPYIGGYVSDGVDIMIASSVLIKNAIGFSGIFLLLVSVLQPLIQLLVVSLSLKLTGAIVDSIGNKKISNFVFSIGKILNMLIACLIFISVMYLMSVGILMSVCNLF